MKDFIISVTKIDAEYGNIPFLGLVLEVKDTPESAANVEAAPKVYLPLNTAVLDAIKAETGQDGFDALEQDFAQFFKGLLQRFGNLSMEISPRKKGEDDVS
jgi:hypothetical protein